MAIDETEMNRRMLAVSRLVKFYVEFFQASTSALPMASDATASTSRRRVRPTTSAATRAPPTCR